MAGLFLRGDELWLITSRGDSLHPMVEARVEVDSFAWSPIDDLLAYVNTEREPQVKNPGGSVTTLVPSNDMPVPGAEEPRSAMLLDHPGCGREKGFLMLTVDPAHAEMVAHSLRYEHQPTLQPTLSQLHFRKEDASLGEVPDVPCTREPHAGICAGAVG